MLAFPVFVTLVVIDAFLLTFCPTWHGRAWRRSTAARRGGMIALAALEVGLWMLINHYPQYDFIISFVWSLLVGSLVLLGGLILFLGVADHRLRDHPHFKHLWEFTEI